MMVRMSEVRLIIAGSRDFEDYKKLEVETNKFLLELKNEYNFDEISPISGNAHGADRCGELYCKKHN